MKVLSLFNGISCGRVALERARIPVERYVSYEIDKYANQIAKANYPDDEYCGDVFKADFTQYRGFDLLIGGSPCTHWSIAKNGRETTSSGVGWELFMQYTRGLVESDCLYFLYENNYSIHKDIQHAISDALGVEPIMINSALVSAQQRKRLYWTNIPNVEVPEDKGTLLRDILESGTGLIVSNQGERIDKADAPKSYCLLARDYNGFWNQHMTGVAEPIRLGNIESTAKDPTSQQYRVYSIHGKSVNLCGQGGGMGAKTGLYYIDLPDGNYIIRKLTPIECERLQTLPDDYTAHVSNTQRYKGIGNGWTVDVIAHILRHIS